MDFGGGDSTTILVTVVLLLAATLFLLRSRLLGDSSTTQLLRSKPKRTYTLLIGLSGSGKTCLFLKLVQPDSYASSMPLTNTSLEPNKAVIHKSDEQIVDFPGHRRLRKDLYPAVQEAKRLVVVIDSVTIQDDGQEGAQALSELLCDVMQSASFVGVASVLMACTKRDDMTSFSSKAVRKVLEAEMARSLTIAGSNAAVGSLRDVASMSGKTIASKKGSARSGERSEDAVLFLRADGKFSFDDVGVPIQFADVSSSNDVPELSVEAVRLFVEGS